MSCLAAPLHTRDSRNLGFTNVGCTAKLREQLTETKGTSEC